jgi:diaminopropionate ammonia-lyase
MRSRHTGSMQNTLPDELRRVPFWQGYRPTPLIELPRLARHAHVGRLFVKVEGARPLGNFKVLGGVLAGLRAIARAVGAASTDEIAMRQSAQTLPRLICASDGNHGLAVAVAAQTAGTTASIYLPRGVSKERCARIESVGATIAWVEGTYDDAVDQAAEAARRGEGLLIPDTSSDPSDPVVRDVMAGYALLSRELTQQFAAFDEQPSHVFVQAGVGGLAASVAQGLHAHMRAPAKIVVVEPDTADCVSRALAARRPVRVEGMLSTAAEMLSCGLASAAALEVLLLHLAESVLVTDEALHAAVEALWRMGGPESTPSGAAGLAGLLAVSLDATRRGKHALGLQSTVLIIATESSKFDTYVTAQRASAST